ncbi:MAG: autotransporter domain-containing protein [Pseudomonadota bacterium]|nr:autotransporter domain-containing protein [Pseudomonadota bacterium]
MNIRGFLSGIALGAAAAAGAPAIAQTAQQSSQQQPVGRIIVFGDSLSDGGFFRSILRLPPGAGRFTTNPDPVAPEVLADRLGLPLVTAYGQGGGTNFAVGGARVTAANGPSIPITTQISNFLAAGGTFRPNDLVYIQGGGNDFFFFQRTGGTNNAILTTAANELAAQVVRLQAAGAERIVTLAVQTGGNPGLQLFNRTYAAALAAANVNALYFDTDRLFNEIVANAASFGITNITSTACLGSSLTCTPATFRTPNANETFLLADSVHPAGITQRIQGQAVASLVQAPEQIGQLSYAAQSLLRGQREMLEGPMRGSLQEEGGGMRLFGNVGYNYFSADSSQQRIGLNERSLTGQIGLDVALGEAAGIGVAGAYSDGDGHFGFSSGGYDVSALSGTVYGRAALGPLQLGASATYGSLSYDDIERRFALGPTGRIHSGDTDGDYLAASALAGFTLIDQSGIRFGPDIGVTYEKVEIDGYAEDGALSTAATFGEQELDSLTGRIGLAATTRPGAPLRVTARVSYEREFGSDEREFTITPVGAPVSYTSRIFTADDDYVSYGLALDGRLSAGLSLRAGVRGNVGRANFDTLTSFAGLSLGF